MLRATIGGLGLTGVIAWADIQLKRVAGPWIDAEVVPFQSMASFLELSRESDGRFEYTVAWLDCFAGKNPRGVFFRGNHAAERGKEFHLKRGPKLPFALPEWMLNRYSVKAFICDDGIHSAKKGTSVVPYDSFFYPLDAVRQWNLLYGKQGFLHPHPRPVPQGWLDLHRRFIDYTARAGTAANAHLIEFFASKALPAESKSYHCYRL